MGEDMGAGGRHPPREGTHRGKKGRVVLGFVRGAGAGAGAGTGAWRQGVGQAEGVALSGRIVEGAKGARGGAHAGQVTDTGRREKLERGGEGVATTEQQRLGETGSRPPSTVGAPCSCYARARALTRGSAVTGRQCWVGDPWMGAAPRVLTPGWVGEL